MLLWNAGSHPPTLLALVWLCARSKLTSDPSDSGPIMGVVLFYTLVLGYNCAKWDTRP